MDIWISGYLDIWILVNTICCCIHTLRFYVVQPYRFYLPAAASAADLFDSMIRGIEAGIGVEAWRLGGWQAGRDAWQAGRLGGREGQNARATVQFEFDIGWLGRKLSGLCPLKDRAGAPIIKKNC